MAQGVLGQPFDLSVPTPRLWSPSDPFLYDLEVSLFAANASSSTATTAAAGAVNFAAQVCAISRGGSPLSYCLSHQCSAEPCGACTALDRNTRPCSQEVLSQRERMHLCSASAPQVETYSGSVKQSNRRRRA